MAAKSAVRVRCFVFLIMMCYYTQKIEAGTENSHQMKKHRISQTGINEKSSPLREDRDK